MNMNFFDRKFFLGLFLGMLLVVIAGFVAIQEHNNLVSTSQSSADEFGGPGCGGELDCSALDNDPGYIGPGSPWPDPGVADCRKCTGWNAANPVCWAEKAACEARNLGGKLPDVTPTPMPVATPNQLFPCLDRCASVHQSCVSPAWNPVKCDNQYYNCRQACGQLYQ